MAEIFLNDTELMQGLLRVTGKHRLERAEQPRSPAAAALASSRLQRAPSRESPLSPTSVPSAFSSVATHFSPIVLSDKDKPQEEKEKKVRTLKELKRNLLKNRQQLNLVQDIEQDAAKVDRPRSQTPGSTVRSKSTSSQPEYAHSPHVQHTISPHVLAAGAMLGQKGSPHLFPGVQQHQLLQQGYMTAPQLQHQAHMYQQHNMYQLPGQYQSQPNLMQAQGMMQQGQMMMQPGQYPHSQNPMLGPGMQQYGNMPYGSGGVHPQQVQNMQQPQPPQQQQGVQMQLQHDPRTGMFTLVPVPGVQTQVASSSPVYPPPPSAVSPVGYRASPSQFHHQRQQSGDSGRGRLTSPDVEHHRRTSPDNGEYYQSHKRRSPGRLQSPVESRHRGRAASPERYSRGSTRDRDLSSSHEDERESNNESNMRNLPARHRHREKEGRDTYRHLPDSPNERERDSRDDLDYRHSHGHREREREREHSRQDVYSEAHGSVSEKLPPTGKVRAKQRPRSAGRDGRSARAKTLSGGDIGRELQRLRSMPSDLEKISEYSSNSRTMESLDRISAEELMEYRARSKSIGALDGPRSNLRRSNSGSSVDYRALEVKVKDIPIDGRRSREQSGDRRDLDRRERSGERNRDRKSKPGPVREKSRERAEASEHLAERRRERSGEGRQDGATSHSHTQAEAQNSPEEYRAARHRRAKAHAHHDSLSPVRSPQEGSPPASPPLSKDSGVGCSFFDQDA